jgi:ABC-type transport system involved in multi-copper enzyme maturation permease subunit
LIWMSWRQFRGQAVVGVIALAVLAAYIVYLGVDIRGAYEDYRAQCAGGDDCAGPMGQFSLDYENTLLYLAGVLALVPGLLGMFWGAPLVTRELETGTQRLVWNQSVTRPRWLLTKLLVVGTACMVVAGAASLLLTWAAAPVDNVADNRFSTVMFGARFLPPIAYAAFAFVLGTVIGLVVRRTVPAMALTLVAFLIFQFLVPNMVRPHLMPAEHLVKPMTVSAINEAKSLGSITGAPVLNGLSVPQGWITDVSELMTAQGKPLDEKRFNDCYMNAPKTGATEGPYGDIAVCLSKLDLHVDIAYQPWNRYWAFQFLESGFYLLMAGVLIGVAMWRIQRRPS